MLIYKVCNLNVYQFFRNFSSFLPAIFSIFVGANVISYFAFISNWCDFAMVMACFVMLYCVVMYFLGMNSCERKQVRKLVVKHFF